MSQRLFHRTVPIAEAVTWTLLIAGILLTHLARADNAPALSGGSIHGLAFIAYGMTAVLVKANQRWSTKLIVLAVVTAIIPYATIPFDLSLNRRKPLEGGAAPSAMTHAISPG